MESYSALLVSQRLGESCDVQAIPFVWVAAHLLVSIHWFTLIGVMLSRYPWQARRSFCPSGTSLDGPPHDRFSWQFGRLNPGRSLRSKGRHFSGHALFGSYCRFSYCFCSLEKVLLLKAKCIYIYIHLKLLSVVFVALIWYCNDIVRCCMQSYFDLFYLCSSFARFFLRLNSSGVSVTAFQQLASTRSLWTMNQRCRSGFHCNSEVDVLHWLPT